MAKKLFVGGLAWAITTDELREAFASFGDIEDAIVITDRFSGRSKGFGFVTFTNDADADAATEEMHEKELKGRAIIVNEARPKEERDDRF
jgi:cold-inducible RNA-binding protein